MQLGYCINLRHFLVLQALYLHTSWNGKWKWMGMMIFALSQFCCEKEKSTYAWNKQMWKHFSLIKMFTARLGEAACLEAMNLMQILSKTNALNMTESWIDPGIQRKTKQNKKAGGHMAQVFIIKSWIIKSQFIPEFAIRSKINLPKHFSRSCWYTKQPIMSSQCYERGFIIWWIGQHVPLEKLGVQLKLLAMNNLQ